MSINMEFLNNLDDYIRGKRYRLVNSVLVYQNDEIIFERYYNKYDENSYHKLWCIGKSIAGLTLGICLDKELIKNIDEPIYKYIPQFDGSKQPYHKLITIRHLLNSATGIYYTNGTNHHHPMAVQMRGMSKDEQLNHIADVKMAALPGIKFNYGMWEVFLLSEVILRACGMNERDITAEYLFKPLEIKYTKDKDGDYHISARDLAKIGLLMLHGGVWNGQQIVSKEYVKAAVSPSDAKNGNEYGYLWWLDDKAYKAVGYGGNMMYVRPVENAVMVILATGTPGFKVYYDIYDNTFRNS